MNHQNLTVMCDIGTVILAESKRSGISAADFGTYLARGAARPARQTDYASTHTIRKHEKVKSYPDYFGHRRNNGVYPCP
jgi:hypothetical protein